MRLAALALASLAICSVASADPVVTQTIDHYDVNGTTPFAVRQSLLARGPTDPRGGRHDSVTHWRVEWRLRMRNVAAGCAIDSVTTTATSTILMPKLVEPTARDDLRKAFDAYLDRLLAHEQGHADNGVSTARQIEIDLMKTPPAADCATVGQAARVRAQALIEDARKRDVAYDAETRHGATQGARFP